MAEKKELEELIRKFGMLNAYRHGGKADVNSVLGKLISEKPELKGTIRYVLPLISSIIEEVNRMPLTQQEEELRRKWPDQVSVEKVREEKVLPPLPNVDKYEMVVTRFSPNPDCVLHLGSLRAIILSYEYAKMYDGLFILRFEDTDPRLKKSSLEFYESIREDLSWLRCSWDQEHIQSDRIPRYYKHGEKLLKVGGGYICTCKREKVKALLDLMESCPCRERPINDHLERWGKMVRGEFKEGKAVFRVKTDLSHPNPAIRDWPAFRIIDPNKHPHPRIGSKYWVWPLYNFASAIDDHLLNISHIIRGKEHLTNTLRQEYLYNHFHWKYPETIHYGRLKIEGADLSKSKIIRSVTSGRVKGYDDPRLATLQALRRRGVVPESLKRMILEIGPKPVDATISWDNVFAYNRKLIDPRSNRYFYVKDPLLLNLEKVPMQYTVRLPIHPDHLDRGYRKITIKPSNGRVLLNISKGDHPLLSPGKVFRLIGLFNVEPIDIGEEDVRCRFHSRSLGKNQGLQTPLVQWVKANDNIDVEVVMPNGTVSKGVGETGLKGETIGYTVQLVRFGFARIDSMRGNLLTLFYAHE